MNVNRRGRSQLRSLILGGLVVAACSGDAASPTGPPPPTGPGPVSSVTVTLASGTISVGETVTASAVARDAQGNTVDASLTWSSSPASVASVAANGTVTGRTAGTATITATAGGIGGAAVLQVQVRDLAAIVESIRAAHGLPAMAGAIVSSDGLLGLGVSGTRRSAGGPAVTLEDKWHIGSNLKAITAALAAIAVGQSRIEWTTTIEEAFPEHAATMRPEYREVTLEDLLANRGGIRNDPPGGTYAGSTAKEQRESLVAWALAADPFGPRGSYYYSNPGFVIAGAMIERAWDGTYEELLATHLAEPLGVTGLGWGAAAAAGASDQPVGHRRQGGSWVPCEACDNPPGLSAAGRAHMRIGDWARIATEFLRADAGTSTLIGAADGRNLFTEHTPFTGSSNAYALGWIMTTRSWAGGRTATHAGSNTVNHSVAWLGLGNGIAFLAATNAADLGGGSTSAALDALIGRLLTLHQTGNS